ncbi:bifunctional diguanylate cyclase/phosphodiesterase [Oleiagrimonas soli]|uniref:bifunctional diguanylate cyclase/phosphodiesterase n=1 Tax=Oleiagrimonas soli TaxID=1543381 RepID=UPI000694097C|nr:EAL domain-containing protein [Oleiagrimonas soli]
MKPRTAGVRLLVASTVYLMLAIAMIAWSQTAKYVAEAWFANALFVALLLREYLRSLPATLIAGLVAATLANLIMGTPVLASLGYGAANMVEVAVAVLLCRQFGLRLGSALGDRFFLLGIAATMMLAPMAGAAVGASVVHLYFHAPWTPTFGRWWLGDAVGMLVLLPPLLAYDGARLRRLAIGDRATLFWLTLTLSLLVTLLAVTRLTSPFVVWSIPLLFVAYRLGMLGTTLACSLNIAAVFVLATAQARGWIHAAVGIEHLDEAELIFFSALAVTGPLLMSVILAQRKRITHRLEDTSTRLQIVADNIPGLIGQLDNDCRYRYVNMRYLEWYDLREADVIGKTPTDIFGPETAERLAPRIQRVLQGEAQQFEITMPTGQRLDVRYTPLIQGDRIDGFFVLAHDITNRKELEARLREITDNVPALIAYLDDQLVYRFANGRYLQMWGLDPTEVIGRPAADVAGPYYSQFLRPKQQECLTGKRANVEIERAGRTFELTYIPHIVDGTVRGMYKLGVDVTERKRAEAELFEAMDRAHMMLESIGDAVIACDTRMRVTMMNPIAIDMTGWEEKEALGKSFAEVVQLIDIESGEAPLNPLEVAIRENRIVALQANSALRRRDGLETPIEDSASPIHDRNGEVVGGIMVFHDVSESRAMALKMSHLAQHDYLTDLPNRVLLQDRLSHALASLRPGMQGALLFIDLDHFKNINDSLGHLAGDHVLREVARRLRSSVRSDDTVSRQGGDEFVILLNRLGDPRDAARLAEKAIGAIEQIIPFEDRELHISGSVGIAMFPQDSTDTRTLMKQADTALYHAKQTGRARYSYFTQTMSEKAEERLAIEHSLRHALQNNMLNIVYQPKVRWPEGNVIGAEALVRWTRDDGSAVSPNVFIELAEEVGLITQIDEWVMREVCRLIATWLKRGQRVVPVSVNVSLAHIDNERLLEYTRETLRETGIPAKYLEIEFTESQMFLHRDQAVELLRQLKKLGVRLAVDDFGTGYSNLSYLAQYRFDTLKIDREFVRGLSGDQRKYAIVQAIIAMSQALGFGMIAEGVETPDEAAMLLQHGCIDMQGYLFSKPVPPEDFLVLLRDGLADAKNRFELRMAGDSY